MLSKPVLYLLNNLRNNGAFHAKGEEIKKGKGSKERKQTENGAEELFVLQRNGKGPKFGNVQYQKVYSLWWHGNSSGLTSQHDEDRASKVSSRGEMSYHRFSLARHSSGVRTIIPNFSSSSFLLLTIWRSSLVTKNCLLYIR